MAPEIWWFIRCWLFNSTSFFPLPISFSAPFSLFISTFLCVWLFVCVHERCAYMKACVCSFCVPIQYMNFTVFFPIFIHCWWTFPYTKIKWKQIWYLYFLPELLGSEWCDCKSCIWDWLLVSIVYSLHTQCCRRMKNKNINGNRFYLRHINTFGISMEQA